jgi:hypothetical protein
LDWNAKPGKIMKTQLTNVMLLNTSNLLSQPEEKKEAKYPQMKGPKAPEDKRIIHIFSPTLTGFC